MVGHLKGVTICVAGDLIHDAGNGHWTDEDIKRWLKLRDGKFVDVMDDSVTHLICSRAAFKAQKDKVKYAKRKKDCKIVTYEWLEDTVLLYDQLKRKAPTRLYDPGKPRPEKAILALYRKKPQAINMAQVYTGVSSPGTKMNNGNSTKKKECPSVLQKGQGSDEVEHGKDCDAKRTENKHTIAVEQKQASNPPKKGEQKRNVSKDEMQQVVGIPHVQVDCRLYQIYKDPTDGFPYQVEVSCPDKYGTPRGKRWVLQLFESKSTPSFYRFGPVYFEQEGARHECGRGSGAARPKDSATKEFERFFFKKTGVKWEERLSLSRANEQQNKDLKIQYYYYPPAPGEPVGYVDPKNMPGKARNMTKRRREFDPSPLACNNRKRKKGDSAESQFVKATKTTHKKTTAFDDVYTARTANL